MTLYQDLAALDATIHTLDTKVRNALPDLDRRARISSKRDGYPARASGAQPGTITTARETYATSTLLCDDGYWWAGRCSCGWMTPVVFDSSLGALKDAEIHYTDEHGPTPISYSDASGEAAITPHRPDPVRQRRDRISRILTRIERDTQAICALLTEPTDHDEDQGLWCASCARIRHNDGTPHLSPLRTGLKGATDVAGRLRFPMPLCRFCWDHVAAEGVIPPQAFLTEYLTKGRAPRRTA